MSIFKSSFNPNVRKQLEVRQEAIGSKRHTPQTVQYFNARNAWIRMTSAVDVGEDSGALAKSYILQGGTLTSNGVPRYPIGGKEGKYTLQNQAGETNRLGLRPMPGITGIEVKSKSAYGSLREINVSFNCWDIKQLEELELLYMRPGYTVLVEWGWAPFLDNKGNLQGNIQYYDKIFTKNYKKEDIWKETYNKSAETGNYDAMYGFIKNYSWSARPDGGYDCTTSIISMGEILESLKVNYSAFNVPNLEKDGILAKSLGFTLPKEVAESYSQNVVAGLCHELYEIANTKCNDFAEYKVVDANNKNKEYIFLKFPVDISGAEESKSSIIKSGKQIYTTLESFVDIMNRYVLLSDQQNQTPMVKLSVRDSEITAKGEPLLCLGNKYQLTTNPAVCLISNHAWEDPTANFNIPDSGADFDTLKKIVKNTSKNYFYNGDFNTLQFGVIGNIYVNLEYIYKLVINENLAAQDKKEKNDIALFDLIKQMMSGISTAIGNVANFELHIDPTDNNVARIIDVNYVDATDRDEVYKNAFILETHNTKSVVRSYRLESQIFQDQSTIIAIGAQAQGGALGADVNTLVDFNQNLIDRIIPKKEAPTTIEKSDPQEEIKIKVEALVKNIQTLLSYINKIDPSWWEFKGDYDASKASEYSNALKDIINFYKSLVNVDSKNRAIIPTKLSIEMDGIGGIVIGNLFRLPDDLLPRGYKGGKVGSKLAYAVTELGHSLKNNDWVTNLTAQTIILDKPKGGLSTANFATIQKIAASAAAAAENPSEENYQKLNDQLTKIDPAQLPGPASKDIPPNVTVDRVIAAMQRKGYTFYANTNFGRNKVNIVGIREKNKAVNAIDSTTGRPLFVSNYFTDYIVMFYYDENGKRFDRIGWQTTSPGLHYEAKKFGGGDRTIMMVEGQYIDAYRRGKHQGKVDTLCQAKSMKYFRDPSLNSQYNSTNIMTGIYGTNIHPSGTYGANDPNKRIDDWSAGCQVLRSYDDYLWMKQAMINQLEKANYKFFTYTLLNIVDI